MAKTRLFLPVTFELWLPWPVSTNTVWKKKKSGMYLNKKAKDFRLGVVSAVASLPLEVQRLLPIKDEIKIMVGLAPPLGVPRKRDQDNFAGKTLLDALTKAKVYKDDSLIVDTRILWFEPVEYGKTKVRIQTVQRKELYGEEQWEIFSR